MLPQCGGILFHIIAQTCFIFMKINSKRWKWLNMFSWRQLKMWNAAGYFYYMKSIIQHYFDVWTGSRKGPGLRLLHCLSLWTHKYQACRCLSSDYTNHVTISKHFKPHIPTPEIGVHVSAFHINVERNAEAHRVQQRNIAECTRASPCDSTQDLDSDPRAVIRPPWAGSLICISVALHFSLLFYIKEPELAN